MFTARYGLGLYIAVLRKLMLHDTSNMAAFEERKQLHTTSAVTSSRPMLFKLLVHVYHQALKIIITNTLYFSSSTLKMLHKCFSFNLHTIKRFH